MSMTKRFKLKTTATDSLTSVAQDLKVGVDIQRTEKLLPDTNIIETIDEYEVFENERAVCDKYRLILTIKPYCSNILFNTLTEIVKNEGDYDNGDTKGTVEVVTDNSSGNASTAYGVTVPTRNQMIMNTEYSREEIGYEYHPGYDIFNNHIMRNISFKMVNMPNADDANDSNSNSGITDNWENFDELINNNNPSNEQRFNTIGDTMRSKDGDYSDYSKRTSIDAMQNGLKRHLYLHDDLLDMENGDAINNNLTEENGWYGFRNNSTISAEKRENSTSSDWDDMDISRVLNNYDNCDFIDMYPDRTLYSFNPKYNPYQHRAEYNWHIEITYPYRNATNHPLVSNETNGDGKTNGLLILSIEKMNNNGDTPILLVRTYCKHGVAQGDYVYFYYSDDEGNTFTRTEVYYKVTRLGDIDGNNTDYYFYMTDLSLIEEALGEDYWYDDYGKFKKSDSVINNAFSNMVFRFTHLVNGTESEYYFRIFRKLPNLRAKEQNLTQEIAESFDDFKAYTDKNATTADYRDGKINYAALRGFNKEQYQLAFATTIYGDACTQVTFTDCLDAEYIVDNLGRPLTELYVTIVKNNAGNTNWYQDRVYNNQNNEYSHCFGRITSGLFYHTEEDDNTDNFLNIRGEMSDVRVINNMELFSSKTLGEYIDTEYDTSSTETTTNGETIKHTDNEFIGDVVEFVPCQAKEVVLSDVYHRFNTAQREIRDFQNQNDYSLFQYQEITADDYDLSTFTVTNYKITDNIERPEGYYYKAHYNLPIRDFGKVQQDSHTDIRVRSAKPVQLEGIYVQITSSLPHSLSMGDKVYICDDALGVWYETYVAYAVDELNFVINPLSEVNWIKLCDILNNTDSNKQYKVRAQNTNIPDYAAKVGKNKFVWRNVIRIGDAECTIPEYVFANGYFYIEKNLNFFLHRQDADGKNGLYNYAKGFFPNDISGVTEKDDIYEYEDLEDTAC